MPKDTLPQQRLRRELTPEFLKAARKQPKGMLHTLLATTQHVRDEILIPASKHLENIEITRKDTGGQRNADAKTITLKTDKECEAVVERRLLAAYPEALLISEEKYGEKTGEEQKALLEEALRTDRTVLLSDPLDGTRDFRDGGDGYAVLLSAMQGGEVVSAVAHRCTDEADPDGLGHILTYEKGDGVRRDGVLIRPLSERSFPGDPLKLRGYGLYEFIGPMREGKANGEFPDLSGVFDSLSDLFTCTKFMDDLLTGRHHFALVPPPTDIFDYPAAVAMIQKAGGVARYLDGTDASFAEIVRRQDFSDDACKKTLKNTLVFAVSENVFEAVRAQILSRKQAPQQAPRP